MLKLPVVLASASPRRRELLARIVPKFEVLSPDVDEVPLAGEPPDDLAVRLAREKARAGLRLAPDALVIGMDTVVALGDVSLAKPDDREDAVRMLEQLSGHTHRVITGVCLTWQGGEEAFADVAEVTFRELSKAEIEAYVATGEPMDKAGAYAIQGGAAGFVTTLEGDVTTVIGLPIEALKMRLAAFSV